MIRSSTDFAVARVALDALNRLLADATATPVATVVDLAARHRDERDRACSSATRATSASDRSGASYLIQTFVPSGTSLFAMSGNLRCARYA